MTPLEMALEHIDKIKALQESQDAMQPMDDNSQKDSMMAANEIKDKTESMPSSSKYENPMDFTKEDMPAQKSSSSMPMDEPAKPYDELDLPLIKNLIGMYTTHLTDQYKTDEPRYKAIEDALNKSYQSDITPQQYADAASRAHAAQAIANIGLAANLGGNGAAFKTIGETNAAAALEPINQSKYFQGQGRQRAEDQIRLGNLQRENLKAMGGDVENTLKSVQDYGKMKLEKDKVDPRSAISTAELNNSKTQLSGLASILSTAADRNTPEFQTAANTITDLANKLPNLSYNDQQNAIKLAKEQVDAVKGIVASKNAGKMVGIAGFSAKSQDDLRKEQILMDQWKREHEGDKADVKFGESQDKIWAKMIEKGNADLANSRNPVGKASKALQSIQIVLPKLLSGDPISPKEVDLFKNDISNAYSSPATEGALKSADYSTLRTYGAEIARKYFDLNFNALDDNSRKEIISDLTRLKGVAEQTILHNWETIKQINPDIVENKQTQWDALIDNAVNNKPVTVESVKNAHGNKNDKSNNQSSSKQLSPQDQKALDWANKNPTDPRAITIKAHIGVQ